MWMHTDKRGNNIHRHIDAIFQVLCLILQLGVRHTKMPPLIKSWLQTLHTQKRQKNKNKTGVDCIDTVTVTGRYISVVAFFHLQLQYGDWLTWMKSGSLSPSTLGCSSFSSSASELLAVSSGAASFIIYVFKKCEKTKFNYICQH